MANAAQKMTPAPDIGALERETLVACRAVGASIRKLDGKPETMRRLIQLCVALDQATPQEHTE